MLLRKGGEENLTDSNFGIVGRIELHHTGSSGPSIGFVLDFRTLHLSNSIEQFNQIIVASGPWELNNRQNREGLLGVGRGGELTLRT